MIHGRSPLVGVVLLLVLASRAGRHLAATTPGPAPSLRRREREGPDDVRRSELLLQA